MKKTYEKPVAEMLEFGDDVITTSGGGHDITKNPGNHFGCTVMPNGKPIPENAEGYWSNHD